MSKDAIKLEPIGTIPAFDDPGRTARTAGYMARMALAANHSLLAESTLDRLQRSSSTVQEMGLPDLVLHRGGDGAWVVIDRGAWTLTEADWEAGQAAKEAVRPEKSNAAPVRQPLDPNVRPESASVRQAATEAEAGFDKTAYQREYMRAKRAAEKRERGE